MEYPYCLRVHQDLRYDIRDKEISFDNKKEMKNQILSLFSKNPEKSILDKLWYENLNIFNIISGNSINLKKYLQYKIKYGIIKFDPIDERPFILINNTKYYLETHWYPENSIERTENLIVEYIRKSTILGNHHRTLIYDKNDKTQNLMNIPKDIKKEIKKYLPKYHVIFEIDDSKIEIFIYLPYMTYKNYLKTNI